MPEVTSVQRSPAQGDAVQASIARASAATGVDFDYLLAQAKIESNLKPDARARTSSASGLYQFISSTWLETLDRHGRAHGLDWAEAAITRDGGRAAVGDAGMRSQIMALRFDPEVSSLMAAELARDNASELRGFLGREPDHAELYLAHFLGAGGAKSFLGALQDNPLTPAASLFPKAAQANGAIFYQGGRARSVGDVMELVRGKIERAKESGALSPEIVPGNAGSAMPATPAAAFIHARRSFASEPEAVPSRPSMAETLRATFGGSDALAGRAARQVGEAYGKFRAFGL
ncbi:lytic transglycosylase domain-containing protein [Pelagerythrobacter marensis]|uniref:Lytic transglycosylase domain-containing protein n=1 Tax=Pelagerythrobacter marensis TaxID=543877 RepID=A0ABZ2DB49_9SPHN